MYLEISNAKAGNIKQTFQEWTACIPDNIHQDYMQTSDNWPFLYKLYK